MTFKKISASLALLLASATITACGGNNDTTAECADGEIKAQIGEGAAQCYKTCTADDDCGDGESCTGGGSSKVCVGNGSTDDDMDTTPDDDMDVTPTPDMDTTPTPDMDMDTVAPDADMDTTMPDMDMGPEDMGDPAVEMACLSYCDNLFGNCITNTCTALEAGTVMAIQNTYQTCVNGGTAQDGTPIAPCREDYVADPDFKAQVDEVGAAACGDLKEDVFCSTNGFNLGDQCECPAPTPPVLGTECMTSAECDGGSLTPFCIPENDGMGNDGPPGGQCVAIGCTFPEGSNPTAGSIFFAGEALGCGPNSRALAQDAMTCICLPGCSDNSTCDRGVAAGSTDPGYSCSLLGPFPTDVFQTESEPAGICNVTGNWQTGGRCKSTATG